MAFQVMVRTYGGQNQSEAALLYAEDAPNLSDLDWAPVSAVWVADEWPTNAYLGATLAILVGIGIVLLIVMAMYKPVRTLMVTYQREVPEPAEGVATDSDPNDAATSSTADR